MIKVEPSHLPPEEEQQMQRSRLAFIGTSWREEDRKVELVVVLHIQPLAQRRPEVMIALNQW